MPDNLNQALGLKSGILLGNISRERSAFEDCVGSLISGVIGNERPDGGTFEFRIDSLHESS
jgi:hypothetical protein